VDTVCRNVISPVWWSRWFHCIWYKYL